MDSMEWDEMLQRVNIVNNSNWNRFKICFSNLNLLKKCFCIYQTQSSSCYKSSGILSYSICLPDSVLHCTTSECQKHFSMLFSSAGHCLCWWAPGQWLTVNPGESMSIQVNQRTGVEIAKEVNEVAWDICRWDFLVWDFLFETLLTKKKFFRYERAWRPSSDSPWCSFFTHQDLALYNFRHTLN